MQEVYVCQQCGTTVCEIRETKMYDDDSHSQSQDKKIGLACLQCTLVNDVTAINCTACGKRLLEEEAKEKPAFIPIQQARFDNTVGTGVEGFQGSNQATDGLIGLLDSCLKRESGHSRLISETPHLTQLNAMGAQWACGYRNLQMLTLSLNKVPAYRSLLFNGDGNVPDIWGIQAWIEKARAAGFDEIGAADLGRSLVGKSD